MTFNKSRNVVKKKEKKKKIKVRLKKKESIADRGKIKRRYTYELPSKYYAKVSQDFDSINVIQRYPLGCDVLGRKNDTNLLLF